MNSDDKTRRSKVQKLAFALGQIKIRVEEAQQELQDLEIILDPRHLGWRCDGCGHTKHFTKPSTVVACDVCPRCKGTAFSPVVK